MRCEDSLACPGEVGSCTECADLTSSEETPAIVACIGVLVRFLN